MNDCIEYSVQSVPNTSYSVRESKTYSSNPVKLPSNCTVIPVFKGINP